MDGKENIVQIKDVAPPDFELPKLDELVNKTIFIIGFDLDKSQFGEYCVIHTKGQGTYFTTSEIFIKQLKRAEKRLEEQGKVIGKDVTLQGKVKSKKGKEGDYYILE